jgi:hypothetical protein
VHVLKPIEEQRRGMRMMQSKGYLPPSQVESFEQAEELCSRELKSIMEESQQLVPGMPPNSIIQAAVQRYHQGLAEVQGDDEGEGQRKFEDIKRGFFKSAPPPKMAHGFPLGSEVQAFGLQTESMNGAIGRVKGTSKGDRVAVIFPEPIGEKALRPNNLRRAPEPPVVHPDARDAPGRHFRIMLSPSKGEPLGIKFVPQPPPDEHKEGMPSWLFITGFHENGHVLKYNAAQKDPSKRVRPGDRIMAIVDGSLPEAERKPVGGNCKEILRVMMSGKSPLFFVIERDLGPPLRFKMGQRVKANCGDKGWVEGTVIDLWEDGSDGAKVPYVIRLQGAGNVVCAPKDHDNFVVKGDPRFKAGDDVMANYNGGYKRGKVVEVKENKTFNAYGIKIVEGDGGSCEAPEDLNQFVRPVARYEKDAKVLANVGGEFKPGTIEAVYHPNWVYAVRLDAGNVVCVPEDTDQFMKLR